MKTRHLERDGQCSGAVGLPGVHLVVEVEPRRLTTRADLGGAVAAFGVIYRWPTQVVGDQLDAPYAAPTSGGPPFHVYALTPTRAHAFPTDDTFEPTRYLSGPGY